jgi:hypothetical protein
VLEFYEEKMNIKHKNKAARIEDLKPEHRPILEKLLKYCSSDPQAFWDVASPRMEIETLHDNGVTGELIPYTHVHEQEIKN